MACGRGSAAEWCSLLVKQCEVRGHSSAVSEMRSSPASQTLAWCGQWLSMPPQESPKTAVLACQHAAKYRWLGQALPQPSLVVDSPFPQLETAQANIASAACSQVLFDLIKNPPHGGTSLHLQELERALLQVGLCLHCAVCAPQVLLSRSAFCEGKRASPRRTSAQCKWLQTWLTIGHRFQVNPGFHAPEQGSSLTDRGSVSKVRDQTLRDRSATI